LLLGEGLGELGLQSVDSFLIGCDQSVRGSGHDQGADDQQDTETSQHVRPATARSRRGAAAVDDVEPGTGRVRVIGPRRRRLASR
jgi:hypothetical protein